MLEAVPSDKSGLITLIAPGPNRELTCWIWSFIRARTFSNWGMKMSRSSSLPCQQQSDIASGKNLVIVMKPSSMPASGMSPAPGTAKLIISTSSLNSTFVKWSKCRIISERHRGLRTCSAYFPSRFRTASSKALFKKTDPQASAVPIEHSLIMKGLTDSTS